MILDDGDYRLALAGAEAKLATQNATLARIDEQIAAARIGVDQARAQLDAATADSVRAQTIRNSSPHPASVQCNS